MILRLHVRRPLRFPGKLLGRLVFGAIQWSPFVQDGGSRATRGAREPADRAGPAQLFFSSIRISW